MIRAIYVHIPFCSYRCPYCNFVSLTNSPISPEDYVDLVIKEAKLYGDMRVSPESLYFGGGTPTLLKPSLLGRLMEGLSGCFDFSNLREVTVERNPETYSLKELKALRDMGINRLSIGVQSFTEKGLRALGRKHTREDVIRAYEESVEAGFDNINLDLIYAYPGQSVEDVEEEIRWLGILKPRHVSAYMLTPHLPDEETLSSIYDALWKGLRALGYRRYEISNWALEGGECVHNLFYWTREEFLGLGLSAWSFYGETRYGNTKNILTYAEALQEGRKPTESVVRLGEEERFEEFLMLCLRLREGLPYALEHLIPAELEPFFEKGERGIGIKEEFMLLANEIISEVLVYNSHRKATEVLRWRRYITMKTLP